MSFQWCSSTFKEESIFWHLPIVQYLVDTRLDCMFHTEELLDLMSVHSSSDFVARLILDSIDSERDLYSSVSGNHALWNLVDCFESIVCAAFHSKTTLSSACCVGKLCADKLAECLEYSTDSAFDSYHFQRDYEISLDLPPAKSLIMM